MSNPSDVQKQELRFCRYETDRWAQMLKALFDGMLEVSSAYYGDAIGLAPIALAQPKQAKQDFWQRECQEHPTRIACLNYES